MPRPDKSPNQVFSLYLCRGDINSTDCNKCVNTASHDLHQSCSYHKAGVVWYDYCLAYYSGHVLSVTNNSVQLTMWNQNPVSDVDRFNDFVLDLMNATADYAVKSTKNLFATGSITGYTAKYPTLYGLVQCTPDMRGKECRQCLQQLFDAIGDSQSVLVGKQGGRIIGVRCNMRYEVGQFFQGDPMVKLISASSSPSPSPSLSLPSPPSPSPPVSTLAAPPLVGASGKRTCLGVALGTLIQIVIAAQFI